MKKVTPTPEAMAFVKHCQALYQKGKAKPAKPIGGLLDARFVYVPAAATDIRKTFERIRNERLKGKAL